MTYYETYLQHIGRRPDGSPRGSDPRERLLSKVGATDDNGCWGWTGYRNRLGYGVFSLLNPPTASLRKNALAHRFVYETLVGPIPDGLVLDHLCRNRACVNPAHLEPVSGGENVRRGGNSLKTHCHLGHEYTPENTYYRPDRPGRRCRECIRICGRRFSENHRDYLNQWQRDYRASRRLSRLLGEDAA